MSKSNFRWSTEEDTAIMQAVAASPYNIRDALQRLSESGVDRTPAALVSRYYNVLLPRQRAQAEKEEAKHR